MAYWSYCQSCKQWSKSAASITALKGKSCPYCGNPLTKDNLDNNAEEKKDAGDVLD